MRLQVARLRNRRVHQVVRSRAAAGQQRCRAAQLVCGAAYAVEQLVRLQVRGAGSAHSRSSAASRRIASSLIWRLRRLPLKDGTQSSIDESSAQTLQSELTPPPASTADVSGEIFELPAAAPAEPILQPAD